MDDMAIVSIAHSNLLEAPPPPPQLTMGWIDNRNSPQQVFVILIHDYRRHDHDHRCRCLH